MGPGPRGPCRAPAVERAQPDEHGADDDQHRGGPDAVAPSPGPRANPSDRIGHRRWTLAGDDDVSAARSPSVLDRTTSRARGTADPESRWIHPFVAVAPK